jgi:hypothetical protein
MKKSTGFVHNQWAYSLISIFLVLILTGGLLPQKISAQNDQVTPNIQVTPFIEPVRNTSLTGSPSPTETSIQTSSGSHRDCSRYHQ